MKRFAAALIGLGTGLLLASAAPAYFGSYVPGAGINATPHDLSRIDTGMIYQAIPPDALNRICVFCHAPHNTYRSSATTDGLGLIADDGFDDPPSGTTRCSRTPQYIIYEDGGGEPVYGGAKPLAAIDHGMTAGGTSLLCLSCHDGSVAPNDYGSPDGQLAGSVSSGGGAITESYRVGKDRYLGNHHPIGFTTISSRGTTSTSKAPTSPG